MIVGAAVCPGAPFLVEGVADGLRLLFPDLGAACLQALSTLPAADCVVAITGGGCSAGRSARWLRPGSVLRSAGFVRSDHPAISPVELAPGGGAEAVDPSAGAIVAAHLLAAAAIAVPTTVVEIDGDPDEVALQLTDEVDSTARVALLVIADGAACHGDGAPGRRDDRAAPFDDRIARALDEGNPAALAAACADPELAAPLLARVDPLVVLARVTAGRPPTEAQLLYSGAPTGVGYFVGRWRWTDGEPM